MVELEKRIGWLRWSIVAELILLAVQYEVGTSVSITGAFPDVPASGFSLGTFGSYVAAGGGGLVFHSILGILLLASAVLVLVLALGTRVRWLRITAAVELIFMLSAAVGGLFFVLSGFRDNSSSYQMSTGFLIAFVFTFLSLYLLRNPEPAAAVAEPS